MKPISAMWWTALLVALPPILGATTNVGTLTADQKRLQLFEGSLDGSFSECSDFFQYACKGLPKYRGQNSTGNLQFLDERVGNELSKDIRQLRPTTEFKFLREIYKYYKSCNEEKNVNDTVQYFKWMSDSAGIHWRLTAEMGTTFANMDWIELLAATRKYGFNDIFVHEDIIPRQDDALQMAIELKSPPLKPLYSFREQLHKYGLENKLSALETSKFALFQDNLAKLTSKLVEVEGTTDHMEASPTSLENLNVSWVNRYIQSLLGQSQVDTSMIVYVHNKEYLKGLGEFLNKYYNSFLSDYIQIKFFMFLKNQDDSYVRGSCELNVRNLFPLPMQWIYTKWHPELQQELPHIRNMFDYLKATFRKTLTRNIYNFSADIVKSLQAKIDSIQLSADAVSMEDLENFYENLHLNTSEYFGNRLRLANFYFNITHQLISKRLTRNSITMLSLRPTHRSRPAHHQAALYHYPYLFPRFNLVYLPLTLLQNPYYEHGLADVYSYSSIGVLLAQEIIKAFDLHHLQVDAEGQYNTVLEEAILSNTEFQNAAKNLQDSLRSYKGMQHEAFGVNSGLKLAYDTMLELHPDPWSIKVTLQGKKVEMDKVFFLSFAHNYCSDDCYSGLFVEAYYDSCTRVGSATGHFDKFGQAFNCGNSTSNQLWR